MKARLRIREICESLGMTMGELAAICGIARPTLSAYNTGRRNPTLGIITRISGSVGIPAADLIDEGKDDIDENIDWFAKFTLEERLRYSLAHREVVRRLRSFKPAEVSADEEHLS